MMKLRLVKNIFAVSRGVESRNSYKSQYPLKIIFSKWEILKNIFKKSPFLDKLPIIRKNNGNAA